MITIFIIFIRVFANILGSSFLATTLAIAIDGAHTDLTERRAHLSAPFARSRGQPQPALDRRRDTGEHALRLGRRVVEQQQRRQRERGRRRG